MKNDIAVIPTAIQLCFDDVGWHAGEDMRYEGFAPRSGLPRHHAVEDYEILHELGRAINQKILAPLVLGDWDKENVLRGKVGLTHDPAGWDRASEIDYPLTEKCFEVLDGSDYIEYAIHGILHSAYTPEGKLITAKEYFREIPTEGGKLKTVLTSEEDFNTRMECFFDIFRAWGFKKHIRTFVSPCGMKNADDEIIGDLTERLSKRGIEFFTNYSFHFDDPLRVYNGITIMKKGCSYKKPGGILEWNVYDYDPSSFVPFVSPDNFGGTNIIGLHWTNLLRYQPETNMERLPLWIKFFKRESETFGTMISRDICFSATQQFYRLFAKEDIQDGVYRVDLSEVLKRKTAPCPDEFFVSFRKGTKPSAISGAQISLYEEHENFNTYKIAHDRDVVEIKIQ